MSRLLLLTLVLLSPILPAQEPTTKDVERLLREIQKDVRDTKQTLDYG